MDHLVPGGSVLERCGPTFTVTGGTVAPGDPIPVGGGSNGQSGFHILLEEGPRLRANPTAQAAFQQAVQFLESIFTDPITIVVDAEIAPLPANVIGQTSSVEYHVDSSQYDSVRNLLVNAAVGNEGVVYGLPTSYQFTALIPQNRANPFSIGGLTATRANLLALGVSSSELQSGPSSAYNRNVKLDMSMTFNSAFPFDYNQADGISAGKIDFTGVVEHEIAHGMGFQSEVDTVDYLLNHPALSRAIYPTTMDLYRLLPGDGALDFSNSPRVLVPGNIAPEQVFYDGGNFNPAGISLPGLAQGDIPLSTGQFHGDGSQASHWIDGNRIGFNIGVMNPSAAFGQPLVWTDNDTRALGLIGWLVGQRSSIQGTVSQIARSGSQLTASGLPGVQVYLDENRDGVFEPWEPSVTTDGLGDYRFFGLTAGSYLVRTVPMNGYAPATPTPALGNVGLCIGQTTAGPDFSFVPAVIATPWNSADIGPVGQAGVDSSVGGVFNVASGGTDIAGISDSFHFVYQSLIGDCTIIARLDSFSTVDPWAKAGIMIHGGLWKSSSNVFLGQTYSHGTAMLDRAVAARIRKRS